MDRPNANTNTTTGTHASMAPKASKPSSPDRWPCWKTQTSAPNVAPSDRVFITSALTGTSTEPVIRNSSTNVASADQQQRPRQPVGDLAAEVDQERGAAGDVVWCSRAGRRAAARTRSLRDGALRCARSGITSMTDSSVPRASSTLTPATPGQDADRPGVGADGGVVGRALRDRP